MNINRIINIPKNKSRLEEKVYNKSFISNVTKKEFVEK